ncbi:MAG: EAL and HDOD domain-containing protein [Bacillota bacterium]
MVVIESFVARQPIFDNSENVFAYELLYRDSFENAYNPEMDGSQATSQVLTSSFGLIGIQEMTSGKRAFVNFTKDLLTDKVATVFSNQTLVVEILENIEATSEVINACKHLKKEGYLIALDDFVFEPQYIPLIEIADIIKVDFMISNFKERKRLVEIAKRRGIELLAEKIETRDEFKEAKEMGYSYFQGYFFSKPTILSGEELPTYPTNYFQALNALNKEEPDFKRISEIIERDMSLSYKLLHLINSAAFSLREEVESIHHALVLLGLDEVKKWFNLIIINELADDDDLEVIRVSLIRAKFGELIAESLGSKDTKNKFFLMGLFSMIDVLMNQNLEKLLEELPLAQEIKDGLLGIDGLYKEVYDLIMTYEQGDWANFGTFLEKHELNGEEVKNDYLEAVKWSNEIISSQITGESIEQ